MFLACLGDLFRIFWDDLDMILGWFGDDFGVILECFWNDFGIHFYPPGPSNIMARPQI